MRLYTTGAAARIFGVAIRTVDKWCDRGDLRSYRVPMPGRGKHKPRRIPESEMVRFAREHGLGYVSVRLGHQGCVAAYGLEPGFFAGVVAAGPSWLRVRECKTEFETGEAMADGLAALLLGPGSGRAIVREAVRRMKDLPHVVVVVPPACGGWPTASDMREPSARLRPGASPAEAMAAVVNLLLPGEGARDERGCSRVASVVSRAKGARLEVIGDA